VKDSESGVQGIRVAVIGAGSWGTTIANHLARKGVPVDLWVREEEVYNQIRADGVNEVFLPGVSLAPALKPCRSFDVALRDKDLVILVIPSHVFRSVLIEMKSSLEPGTNLVAATKGIENETLMIMSQVAEDVLGTGCIDRFACLAGPSFAREVSLDLPTAVTIASHEDRLAEILQRLFYSDTFRVYTSHDVVGAQLAGALKNVIAIAAGAADGLEMGSNARAALITRGLAEITRLGVAMGANPHTLAGLAGMGDLVLTCTGDLSRNRSVGLKIGKGMSIEDITRGMRMVAEGVRTARSAYKLGKKMGVDMPITRQVYHVIYDGKDPRRAVRELMTRELRVELEH